MAHTSHCIPHVDYANKLVLPPTPHITNPMLLIRNTGAFLHRPRLLHTSALPTHHVMPHGPFAQYARMALLIKDKSTLTDEKLPELTEITGDEAKAQEVIEASKASMGQDISPIDLINIERFASRVIALAEYRQKLHTYLLDKVRSVPEYGANDACCCGVRSCIRCLLGKVHHTYARGLVWGGRSHIFL